MVRSAERVVYNAKVTARNESKLVFLRSGTPNCAWCKLFDKYDKNHKVNQILNKYFIAAYIDLETMPDGVDVYSRYSTPGNPSWVIISADDQVLGTSKGPGGNVGFPSNKQEIQYYLNTIQNANTKITENELNTLASYLKVKVQP